MSGPLRVCVDARGAVGDEGGTASFAISLVRALANLSDGDEKYVFLVNFNDAEKLRARVGIPIETIQLKPPSQHPTRSVIKRIPLAVQAWRAMGRLKNCAGGGPGSEIARSDGTVERHKIDVMHFTSQYAFLTNVPFIYHPHDLQHRHLPEFFTPRERAGREYIYSTFCMHASAVSVVSRWGKDDLLRSFGLPDSKIRIVHFAPDLHGFNGSSPDVINTVARKFALPDRFVFYPARTWPHKNHLRLLQALGKLKHDMCIRVPLVCSGAPTEFYPNIEAEINNLGLRDQVRFVGFVEYGEMGALYNLCSAVVIPTLFEAGSFPLWEAFLSKKPVACSNVTSLPEQAGDAALIFDPYNVAEIADAIRRLWLDCDLRAALVARGNANVSRYSWEKTARTFRALYRQLGNRNLTEEDRELLSAPPLM